MNALWLEAGNLSFRSDVPVPGIPLGEALVKVQLAGICGTDLELVSGYYPFRGILGHEFVGVISDCPTRPNRVGERVVGEINASCGTCTACLHGRRTHCPHRSVLGIVNRHGAFADYLLLPEQNLIEIPSDVPDRVAVFTEPLAAALEILEQVQLRPRDRVLLIGAGRLGLLIAQVLNLQGCSLTAVARHETQREALRSFGIQPAEGSLPGGQWDLVVEATGSVEGLHQALEAVRPSGTIVLKSTYRGRAEVDMSRVVVNEIHLIGSRCGPFHPALEWLRCNRVQTEPLVAATFPLFRAEEAFTRARQPGTLKVLLKIGSYSESEALGFEKK